jgi:hypothetical protein
LLRCVQDKRRKRPQPDLIPPWPRVGSGRSALRLRTLQMRAEIPVGKNSTIILSAQFMTTVQEAIALLSRESAAK